jgi:hypothetical protein
MASNKRWYNPGILQPHRLRNFGSSTVDPYDTTGIAGLVGLWDPRLVVKDGSNFVSQWTEVYNSGFNFVQATAANQAVYTANSFGSLPGIVFDGSNDTYQLDFGSSYSTGTVCGVFKPATLRQFNALWSTEGVTGGMTLEESNNAGTLDCWFNNQGVDSSTTSSSSFTSGGKFALFMDYSDPTIHIYVSNVLLGNGSNTGASFYRVVNLGKGGGFFNFSGTMGQLRFYNRALSASDYSTLYAFWQTQGWGV